MESTYYFEWRDYLLLCAMLIASTIIGIYYGIVKRKETNLKEYLIGGENMKTVPVGLSISASIISSITMTAYPAEIYNYGISYGLAIITVPITITIMYYSILPVFYNLKLTSIYEYMGLRFNARIQKITSFLFTINIILMLPIIICLSAISLEQGTGFNTIYISILICLVCTFYTTIGGIKTVIWTDTLQLILMLGSAIVVVMISTIKVGGFWNVLNISKTGGRLDIDFDLDVTKRNTFWTLAIGNGIFLFQANAFNQAYVQKCFTLPSMQHIKKALMIFVISMVVLFVILLFTGLIMYTEFKDCDPISIGKIQYHDQLMSYYILKMARSYPGLSGIFIAGLTSGAISTLSAGMNALSVTIYQDFVSPYLPNNTSEYKIGVIIKITATIVGIVSTSLVYVISKLGNTFIIITSFSGITSGPIFGLFLLGMFTTSANSTGALCGAIGSVLIMTWIVFGSLYYKMKKMIVYPRTAISIDECYIQYNVTKPIELYLSDQDWKPFFLYRISFFYYGILGAALVVIIGLVCSRFTRTKESRVKRELISPWMHWTLKKDNVEDENMENRDTEGVTLKLLV